MRTCSNRRETVRNGWNPHNLIDSACSFRYDPATIFLLDIVIIHSNPSVSADRFVMGTSFGCIQ